MQRLVEAEAARVAGVLRDAGAGCGAAARVPQSAAQAAAAAAALDADGHAAAAAALEDLSRAEGTYREAVRAQGGRHGGAGGGPDDEPVRLRMRALTAALRADPAAARALPSVPVGSRIAEFSSVLADLGAIEARRLVILRSQAAELVTELSNKRARTDAAERQLATLMEELRAARAKQARELAIADGTLSRLRSELAASMTAADEALKAVRVSGATRLASVASSHAAVETEARSTAEKLAAELKAASEAHPDAEAALRKRKARAVLDHETAVRDYDTAIAVVQTRIDATRATLRTEGAPLRDFKQYFDHLDGELERVAVDKAMNDDAHIRNILSKGIRRKQAVRLLQRAYRSWKSRRNEAEKLMKRLAKKNAAAAKK